jgi:hypothetical protein
MRVAKKNVVAREGRIYVTVGKSVYRFNHVPVNNPEALVARVQAAGKIDPARWVKVEAARFAPVKCGKCQGTGQYKTFGECFACQGKGTQDDADQRRNWGYKQHH